jgi:hypothetical protein
MLGRKSQHKHTRAPHPLISETYHRPSLFERVCRYARLRRAGCR